MLCTQLIESVDAEDHKKTRKIMAEIRLMLNDPYASWCGLEQLGAYERGLAEGRRLAQKENDDAKA